MVIGFSNRLRQLQLIGDRCEGGLEVCNSLLFNLKPEDWQRLTFMIFDVPTKKSLLEERYESLKKLTLPPHVKLISVTKCESVKQLHQTMLTTLKQGREGVILRKPASYYHYGRSPALLKVQVNLQEPAPFIYQVLQTMDLDEARVIGYF